MKNFLKQEELEEVVVLEGKLRGVFTGFRNFDTHFKFIGGYSWRQDEYLYQYHKKDTPRAKIIRVGKKGSPEEIFYIEVDGVTTRVKVKPSYV